MAAKKSSKKLPYVVVRTYSADADREEARAADLDLILAEENLHAATIALGRHLLENPSGVTP